MGFGCSPVLLGFPVGRILTRFRELGFKPPRCFPALPTGPTIGARMQDHSECTKLPSASDFTSSSTAAALIPCATPMGGASRKAEPESKLEKIISNPPNRFFFKLLKDFGQHTCE